MNKFTKMLYIGIIAAVICMGVFNPADAVETMQYDEYGNVMKTLVYDDLERSYLVFVPESYNEDNRYSLLVCLHGFTQTADDIVKWTQGRYNELAERDGAVVIYPNAANKHWNEHMGGSYELTDDVDDIGFLTMLIDKQIEEYNINPENVFLTGISNGGEMTYRLSCEIPEKLCAVAPVISKMGVAAVEDNQNAPPVPILMMNGTSDPIVHWDKGRVMINDQVFGDLVSMDDNINYWLKRNGACDKSVYKKFPDINKEDHSTVESFSYPGSNGNDVVIYRVNGGGHAIPVLNPVEPCNPQNPQNTDIEGSEEIWNFFMSHKKD